MPQKLYRYRSVKSGVGVARLTKDICAGSLYCARRSDLNDPFELRSPLSSKMASSYFGNSAFKDSMYFEQLKEHFDEKI